MRLMKKLVCVAMLLCAMQPATAGTVTLGFEAEVLEVNRDTPPLQLPFEVEAGDRFRGTFTFEPLDVGSEIDQTEIVEPYAVKFVIDGYAFSTADYVAQSFDNILSDEDLGSPPAAPEDVIRLKKTLGESLGDSSMLQWGFAFAFFGDEHVMSGADFPADIEAWRDFSEASVRVTFANQGMDNSSSVLASIVALRQVPEPKASSIFAAIAASLFLYRIGSDAPD
ncbi:hypothetical protein NG895_14575 [Aeoliella sp. ICT_H6.2]|uniref:Uncharacterized protein n=1 Tax=Aeoliella straminimaris TaxID=2954799 RepID=A0A9X2JHZ6_9BACT|nr:hypothetical protein [Aeoliella straminimaris]MCO6045133.1 hypothetical protein [Aeoliella straminimaris]